MRPSLSIAALVLLGAATAAGAQGWARTIGGAGHEEATSITPLADGGFLIAASSQGSFGPVEGCWLLRLDAAGDLRWQRFLPTGATGWFGAAETSDGDFVVTAGDASATACE